MSAGSFDLARFGVGVALPLKSREKNGGNSTP